LDSADVNAGTASAARIAMIAITTSNSMSVNAEEGLFSFIFIRIFSADVLRVSVLRGFRLGIILSLVCLGSTFAQGFGGQVFWGFGLQLKRGLSQYPQMKSIIIFSRFFGGLRKSQTTTDYTDLPK
jgi:hypothetical protein